MSTNDLLKIDTVILDADKCVYRQVDTNVYDMVRVKMLDMNFPVSWALFTIGRNYERTII